MQATMYHKTKDYLLLLLIMFQVAQSIALAFVWAEVRDLRADFNHR